MLSMKKKNLNLKKQKIQKNNLQEDFSKSLKGNFELTTSGTYDKSMNIKYNVDFNNKAISRIKNSF